ncbi:MAG: type II 3-dehydroquinate dehydratase [Candidatus Saccharicenans sp.]|uniref:type II 3-dehydroquinate dehydratase n=1 Tax=Candidatus Saccharicenans sp. TaxID=2819258 RepID=UPI004049FB12
MKIIVINGPNLNLLSRRKPDIYGTKSLEEINHELKKQAEQMGIEVEFFQSNHEGEIIDRLQKETEFDGVIINPGALAHYSYSLRDALESLTRPAVEVHLSNIFAREDFRKQSVTAAYCRGVLAGFGWQVYAFALNIIVKLAANRQEASLS